MKWGYIMTFEKAERILKLIEATKLKGPQNDLIICALRYARIRTDFHGLSVGERARLSPERTATHNSLIDACNILSRAMAKVGEDNSWRNLMGDDRKEIGDFACHLHCILGPRER
jgi:hypothetical protein